MNLRTALELRGIEDIDDEEIRRWIAVTDQDNKGYVDIHDYQLIYKNGIKPNTTFNFTSKYQNSTNLADEKQGNDIIDKAKQEQLYHAFQKYDIDQDGHISAQDLIEAFAIKGKHYSSVYINEWIKRRDLTGKGFVSFNDFVIHFQKSMNTWP